MHQPSTTTRAKYNRGTLPNSVDEAREGHGSEITVTAYNDHSIAVNDRGRGVPLGYNESEGRWNWDLIYCELYAGGKYDNNEGDSAYEFSLGLNGLGACATQYSSEFMNVYSYDGANESKITFKKGNVASELTVRPLEKNERRTGTEDFLFIVFIKTVTIIVLSHHI